MSDELKPPAPVPTEKPPISPSEESNTDNKNTHNPDVAPPAKERPKHNANPAGDTKKLTKWEIFERGIKIFELFGFIAAIVTAWFIGVQWNEMTKASKVAEKQLGVMQGQSDAMQRQSDVMLRQLDEMKHTRELDERAWVFAEIGDNSLIIEGTNCTVQIHVKNVGKTPAVITGVYCFQTPDTNMIHSIDPQPSGMNATIIPNRNQIVISPNIPLASVVSGVATYVGGTVYYKDMFGNTHWTQFCYALTDAGKFTKEMMLIHRACDNDESNKTN
jgi:hypothetical protein